MTEDFDLNTLVEVELKEQDFLKVKETLTRIGIASPRTKTLTQSCHILHKRGKYYICHFKELFKLDGKDSSFDEEDMGRRNTIANLLSQWGLVKLVDESKTQDPVMNISKIKVLPFKDKDDWTLKVKYNIGKKKSEVSD